MKYSRAILFAAVVVFCLISADSIRAAVFTVTNTNDSGAGSLRQAILSSNVNNENDTINFDAGVFNVPRSIILTTGQLSIEADNTSGTLKSVTINGPGAGLLSLDGNNQSRVLTISDQSNAVINGVTITHGNGFGAGVFGWGGGIEVNGGFNPDGSNNLTLVNSVVTGNSTTVGSQTGGAIFAGGRILILNSAIYNNVSSLIGGGIYIGNNKTLSLINTTVSENESKFLGGGISSADNVTLTLTNCTIAFNRLTDAGAQGGGLNVPNATLGINIVNVRNTIIANNIIPGNFGIDGVVGNFHSRGYNIVGNITGMSISGGTFDQFNVDPRLDIALLGNGSAIPSHALRYDSTAIDAGDNCVLNPAANGGCLEPNITTDQRGVPRPQDGNFDGTSEVDVGAFEVSIAESTITPGRPDLQTGSDSGSSNSDNITKNRDLAITVGGLTLNSTVEFYRNGTLIETTVARGTTATFNDNGLPADGTFLYTAKQITGGVTSLHSAGLTVTIDNTIPTATINQASGQADPTRVQPINFTVTFSEAVLGFEQSDVSLTGSTANVSSASVTLTGAGPAYNAAVGNITSNGTVTASIGAGAVQDIAGNSGAASASTDNTVTLDTISPTVTINQAVGQADPVRLLPVNFTVVFSESVTGFTGADISLAGSTANVAQATFTITGSGTTYNVAVGNIGSNGGFVQASVKVDAAADAAGNLSLVSTSTDNVVTIDTISPTVSINQAAGQADPTAVLPVNFTVVFSEPITGFESNDIAFTGSTMSTAGAVVDITGSGTNYNVAVSNISSNGQSLRVSIPANRLTDVIGNSNSASFSSDNVVTVDNLRPAVTVNQAAGQADPTATGPLNFTVVFSENVTGFTSADVSLAGSSANVSSAGINVTGSGTTYNIAVSNITSNGTVRASIPASSAQDAFGNQNFASTSTDNTIIFNRKGVLFDFDGDGKTDVGIFRPSVGVWWYLRSIDGADRLYQFGLGSDKQVPADYTGDGRTDVAFFRPSTGEWFVERSEDDQFYAFTFGAPGDIPAPGDYDGDGKADAAVFRPSIATWFISKSSGGIDIRQFGSDGDVPTIGDYDGDGKADIAIYRPSLGQWWVDRSRDGSLAFQFGLSTDKPVQGDYTGDGKTDVAIYRPSTGEWFVLTSEAFGVYAFPFGAAGDLPAAGDYDGDGRTDAAVFRPSTGAWFILGSTSGVQIVPQFGSAEDKPVPASFIP